MICSACGKNGVGTESMYGTAGRLMGNPYQPSLENIVNGANKARFRNFDWILIYKWKVLSIYTFILLFTPFEPKKPMMGSLHGGGGYGGDRNQYI